MEFKNKSVFELKELLEKKTVTSVEMTKYFLTYFIVLIIFLAIGCFVAYYVSGHTGIYTSQIIKRVKYWFSPNLKGKRLLDVMK